MDPFWFMGCSRSVVLHRLSNLNGRYRSVYCAGQLSLSHITHIMFRYQIFISLLYPYLYLDYCFDDMNYDFIGSYLLVIYHKIKYVITNKYLQSRSDPISVIS